MTIAGMPALAGLRAWAATHTANVVRLKRVDKASQCSQVRRRRPSVLVEVIALPYGEVTLFRWADVQCMAPIDGLAVGAVAARSL